MSSGGDYSALPSGDDGSTTTAAASGGFVPLGRDTVPDAPPPDVAAAAPDDDAAEPEVVTLTVFANYFIDSVSYGGVPLEGLDMEVSGAGMTPGSVHELTFRPASGGVLAVAARGSTEYMGPALRSLVIKCDSTRSDSPWNFALTPQNAACCARAFAVDGQNSSTLLSVRNTAETNHMGSDEELAPEGWQQDEFDDSEWGVPTTIKGAGSTHGHDGKHPQIPHAEAVWFGSELRAVFRFDVSGRYEAEGRKSAPLLTAIVFRDPLHELQTVIEADPANELDAMKERYPWLLALTPHAEVSGAALQSAVADRPHASVIHFMLDSVDPVTAKPTDAPGNTLIYSVVDANSDLSVILAVLDRWPEEVREKGALGTPLYLAATKRLAFETQVQLLVASASFGRLSADDIALVGQSGCLRDLAETLETVEGLEQFQLWLTATPNVIMCCLSLAHGIKQRIAMEPSRRALFNRTAERLMDVATEFGLCLDVKLSRIKDRQEEKKAVKALLQPDPLETLKLAVRLHDIETVSVPWILDSAQTMDGNSLRFLCDTFEEAGTVEELLKHDPLRRQRPLTAEAVVVLMGTIWPIELTTGRFYLMAATGHPLLAFRAPAMRYWFDIGVYLTFVISFSYALLLGSDTSGLGPVVTIYAWLWVAAALLQEMGQVYQGPRLYFEEFWNWLEMASPLLVGTGLVLNELLDSHASSARVVHSIAALFMWIQLLQVFERFESLGPLVAVIGRMMTLMLQFSALCVVFTAAWSVGMFALLRDTDALMEEDWTAEYSGLHSTAFTLFRVYLGDFGYSFTGAEHETAALVMYGVYLMLIVVLMLNLLIAILSAEHADVYEDIDKEFAFTRTKATLRMRQRVDSHELSPPLNLLQVPSALWSGLRGRGWSGGGRHAAWLCWSVIAMPVVLVLFVVADLLSNIAMVLQFSELPNVKRAERLPVPLLNKLNPQGPWFKVLAGGLILLLQPILLSLNIITIIIKLPPLIFKILLGMDVGLTFEPPQRDLTLEQARAIRRTHWPDDQWSELISSVMDEVFGSVEVDDGIVNPIHLNSVKRTRWLCEQTMRSNKRMDEMDSKVDTIGANVDEMKVQIAQKMDEQLDLKAKVDGMIAQQKATMEKLDALLSR